MTYGNYPDLKSIKRILVIKMRHHGDVLLTAPVFSQLKKELPHARIDAFIYQDTLPMLEGHPAISQYLLYDRGWKKLSLWKKIGKEAALLREIRRNQYDLVMNLTEGDRGAIAAWISGACYTVGMKEGKWGHYTHLVKMGPHPRHTVEKQLDAVRRIGIFPMPEERDLYLQIPQEAKNKVDLFLRQEEKALKECLVIHPVSRWRFKCLSVQQMAQLCTQLHQRGFPLVISSGPDPDEIAMVDKILALAPHVPVTNLAGKLSLKELSALIAMSRALICVDSVPLHIASATKTPVVALFGPTSEQNWGPWMHPKARVVTRAVPCRPCYQDGCGGSKMSDCLFSIPPSQIISALEAVLAIP